MKRSLVVALLLTLIVPALAGGARAAPRRQLSIAAAASLTEFLNEADPLFEKAHPGVTVHSNPAASSTLRIQISQGAPFDVFMSADMRNMEPLVKARLVEKPAIFVHNRLVIVVSRRAKSLIKTPQDLAKPGVKIALAAPEVPVGNYSRQSIKKMDAKYGSRFFGKVEANVKSEEADVKAVVVKVVLGEADAGIVYASDVTPRIAKSVSVVQIPNAFNVIAAYPIAVVTRSRNQQLAHDFMAFVLSSQGKQLLRKHGFLP